MLALDELGEDLFENVFGVQGRRIRESFQRAFPIIEGAYCSGR